MRFMFIIICVSLFFAPSMYAQKNLSERLQDGTLRPRVNELLNPIETRVKQDIGHDTVHIDISRWGNTHVVRNAVQNKKGNGICGCLALVGGMVGGVLTWGALATRGVL